jgi:hypothetical protein
LFSNHQTSEVPVLQREKALNPLPRAASMTAGCLQEQELSQEAAGLAHHPLVSQHHSILTHQLCKRSVSYLTTATLGIVAGIPYWLRAHM